MTDELEAVDSAISELLGESPRITPTALRKARPLIEYGDRRHICNALVDVRRGRFRSLIMRRLKGYGTYEVWLASKFPDVFDAMCDIPGAFQQGRLQWIDHMIAQEEA